MAIEHTCDSKGCHSEPEECFCPKCLDEKIDIAFNDGFEEGKREGLKEANNE